MRTADYSLINDCIKSNLRFAAFCQPGQNTFTLLLQTSNELHEIHSLKDLNDERGFIISPFSEHSKHKTIIIKDDIVAEEGDHIQYPESIFSEKSPNAPMISPPGFTSRKEYTDQFNVFHDLLSGNSLQKVILSRKILYEISPEFDLSVLFQELNSSYIDAFTYVVNTPETGCWLGASPEQLLRVFNGEANAVSLAGTQEYEGQNVEEISWNIKEILEHKFVTEYIEQLLGDYVEDNMLTITKETIKAGNVLHLKTLFSFPSSSIVDNLGDFISRLHPTPAVCGLPREQALDAISTTETYDREYYSGFLGILDMRDMTDLYVNLRCLQARENHLYIYAGGGLTIDSDPVKEWEETNMKANTLISVLNKLKESRHGLS